MLPNLTYFHSPILSDSQAALWSFIVQESVTCSLLPSFFNSLIPAVHEKRTSNNQFLCFLFPLLWWNLWWSIICVMLTHQVMLKNENGAWPKQWCSQICEEHYRKIIGEIMIATYRLKPLLPLLETTMLLEKIMTTAMHFSIMNKQFSMILLHIHT